jgi:hypothetical protein
MQANEKKPEGSLTAKEKEKVNQRNAPDMKRCSSSSLSFDLTILAFTDFQIF